MSEEWYEGAYYNRKFTFRFGDCDIRKKASLYAIMKLLSEIAGDDYEGRGLGHTSLQKKRQALLLSRLNLQFKRIPLYSEKVTARTWERFVKGPFFYRDYEILSESGQILVAGSSLWLLVDTVSREILRPESLIGGNRQADPRKSDCPECGKIKKYAELPVIGLRPVYYSDLDGNGHVNNAVYGKIAADFLPDVYRNKDINAFSINFNMEIKLEDVLEICGAETEKGFAIQGKTNSRLNFGCEFEFQKTIGGQ